MLVKQILITIISDAVRCGSAFFPTTLIHLCVSIVEHESTAIAGQVKTQSRRLWIFCVVLFVFILLFFSLHFPLPHLSFK